ncbi:hypothetical protein GOP47_0007558 [Adiantum capillus-veneris]|uniref:DUF7804 domain-containing protein n=1 Tax=Adiantum capillus-veneris TaxID=13818 RepID=A0A9D4V195_ADICA|nr:hypothetical protein GOP47_0007558 [Adiantum capillus-veneris]
MASEALLRGRSSLASCSSNGLHESLKTSDYSSSSFLPLRNTKGVHPQQRLVSRLACPQKATCSEAIIPLPRHDQPIGTDSYDAEQQMSSPDRWLEDCVCDIVRNINEAPFLHMLFDSKDSTSGVKSQRQKVKESGNLSVEDKWREVKDSVKNAAPDGVILVHHLDGEAVEGCCIQDGLSSDWCEECLLYPSDNQRCLFIWNLHAVLSDEGKVFWTLLA